jgi:hypothetical protein
MIIILDVYYGSSLGVMYCVRHGFSAFHKLGGVFLSITGSEVTAVYEILSQKP